MPEARDFDGTNDNITFGSDASVDGFTTYTISMWAIVDSLASRSCLWAKDAFQSATRLSSETTGAILYGHGWSTALLVRWSAATITAGVRFHLVVQYDTQLTTNDAVIYFNGASQSITESSGPPAGTLVSDAADAIYIGESGGGTEDLNGQLQNIGYVSGLWTAEQVNRAMWWGRPGGGMEFYHPLFTDKLANEGSATANGTASGTTVVPLVCPVVRPGTALMGMGVGW